MPKQKSKLEYYGITYKRKRIRIPYPRPIRAGTCVACKRSKNSGQIKVTALHHTIYKFSVGQVLKNVFLALKNTLELCFPCHQIADGFRAILTVGSSDNLRSMTSMLRVAKLLPKDHQRRLAKFGEEYFRWWNNQ